jgi:hypothetical protein
MYRLMKALGAGTLVLAATFAASGVSASGSRLAVDAPRAGEPLVSPEYAVTDEGGGWQNGQAIGFDGINYLVGWQEESRLKIARVNQFGGHLDGTGIDIAPGSGPRIAFDTNNYLLAWNGANPRGNKAARVSPQGVVLEPGVITVAAAPNPYEYVSSPSVAFDGAKYLLAWTHSWDFGGMEQVPGAQITTEGVVLRRFDISSAFGSHAPAVAAGHENSIVVWHNNHTPIDLYAGRVSHDGVVLDPNGIPLSAGTFASGALSPSMGRTTSSPGRTGRPATSTANVSPRTERCSIPAQSRSRPQRRTRLPRLSCSMAGTSSCAGPARAWTGTSTAPA